MSSNNMLAAILDSVFTSSLTSADHARINRAGRQAATISTIAMLAMVGAGLTALMDETGTGARLGLVALGVSLVPLLLVTLVLLPSWAKSSVRKKILQELYPADD